MCKKFIRKNKPHISHVTAFGGVYPVSSLIIKPVLIDEPPKKVRNKKPRVWEYPMG